MNYFRKYTSNTLGGSGNQLFFTMEEGEVRTGRAFYKITAGGRYNYSILYSNIMDSTFADGAISHKNFILDSWTIHSMKLGKCSKVPENVCEAQMDKDIVVTDFYDVTFDGKSEKEVHPGEFFSTDPVELEFSKGEYLCIEMTFSGKMIPYHEESLLPIFVKNGDGWEYSKLMPPAGMIGCDRAVKKRIAFFGDSITQGIGTDINSYQHWNKKLADKLGDDYAYWNLGIGYGRANDAASDGAWLYKAKQNDIAVVCFGVNDILQGFTSEQIKTSLFKIVNELKERGIRIILQTVPPFDYDEYKRIIWEDVNNYIQKELVKYVDTVFDVVSVLCVSPPNLPDIDCP